VSAALETARQQWEDGYRRLESYVGDRRVYRTLLAQVDAITDELRRRVGQTFTLAELAQAYSGAERWSRDVVAAAALDESWVRTLSTVEDAAFYFYARGAADYAP
jgi:hypothetical protein